MRIRSLALIATSLAAAPAPAQLTWHPAEQPAGPPARYGHAMVYESPRAQVVLFGGTDGRRLFADTWVWKSGAWRKLVTRTSPPARHGHAMAHDGLRARTVLFGGVGDSDGVLGDTWVFDGRDWTMQRTVGDAPAARSGHALAHDGYGVRHVLFGGRDAAGRARDDMWALRNGEWSLLTHRGAVPPARHGHVFDFVPQRALLLGGVGRSGPLGDAWEWDGEVWTRVELPASIGGAAVESAAVYQGAWRFRIVAYGGRTAGDVRAARSSATTAERHYRGGRWLVHSSGSTPGPRSEHAMARHQHDARTILFGGRDAAGRALGDTWTLRPTVVAVRESFGSGCGREPWARGPVAWATGVPLRGDADFGFQLFAGRNAPAALLLGGRRADVQLGACRLRVVPDLVLGARVDANGIGRLGLPIPFDPALRGAELFAQLLAADRSGYRGIGFGHGVRIVIGD